MKPATVLQRCFGASVCIVGGLVVLGTARSWQVIREYPNLIYTMYGGPLLYLLSLSVVNLTCWLFLICRFLLLKETGRKLVHFEKQLQTGQTAAEELARRFQQP